MHTLDTMKDVLKSFPNGEKYVEENFYLIGVAYDNLLECGLKPFVELSFMPDLLAKESTSENGFYHSNMNEPRDYKEWANYIKHFIEFLIHRYGIEEVRTWYFEVWNEPDLYGAFFLGDKAAYFKLYKETALAIKSVDSSLRVGGPSTSASRWVNEFVEYCKKDDIPLDFVSTHQYPGDPLAGVSGDEEEIKDPNEKLNKMNKLMNQFADSLTDKDTPLTILRRMLQDPTETKDIPSNIFRKNAKIVKNQTQGLPLFYTEWALSAVFSAYSNDTKKAASYIVKTTLDIEPYVDGTSLWCMSDIFEEMHQFKEEFHGGFGLQTIHGILKPSYYAMQILSNLPNKRYILDENATDQKIGIAAFKDTSRDDILLFSHSMKTIESETEEVEVIVSNPTAPKKVVVKRIDDTHGNPLALWEEKGQPKYLKPNEVKEMIEKSKVEEEILEFEFIDNKVIVNVNVDLNDVYFIQIYW